MHASTPTQHDLVGLIAILRGLLPAESVATAQVLYDAGFRIIEVPLNSPDPLQSIAQIKQAMPADCLVGAGTVLSPLAAEQVKDVGGDLIVMPHADVTVITHAKQLNMICVPGAATVTEAFTALAAGADALKMFPAEQLGPAVMKAWRSVLPTDVALMPVGGINPTNMDAFFSAGAAGFGLGSALFRPGQSVSDTQLHAQQFQAAWKALKTAH